MVATTSYKRLDVEYANDNTHISKQPDANLSNFNTQLSRTVLHDENRYSDTSIRPTQPGRYEYVHDDSNETPRQKSEQYEPALSETRAIPLKHVQSDNHRKVSPKTVHRPNDHRKHMVHENVQHGYQHGNQDGNQQHENLPHVAQHPQHHVTQHRVPEPHVSEPHVPPHHVPHHHQDTVQHVIQPYINPENAHSPTDAHPRPDAQYETQTIPDNTIHSRRHSAHTDDHAFDIKAVNRKLVHDTTTTIMAKKENYRKCKRRNRLYIFVFVIMLFILLAIVRRIMNNPN